MLSVEVTPLAAAQIEQAAAWWSQNRPAAPNAIRIDFEEATKLLASQPGVGAKSSNAKYPELRRLFLSRIRYHIYYRTSSETLVILAFWHSSRGTGPRL